jgi:uncharacterized membrane protein
MQSKRKQNFRYLLAIYIILIGFSRLIPFVVEFLKSIMPDYIPYHYEIIYFTGAIEVILGIMLLFEKFMRLSGYLLIALYLAVLPAHVYGYFVFRPFDSDFYNDMIHLIRNLFQIVYIIWTYWCTKADINKS